MPKRRRLRSSLPVDPRWTGHFANIPTGPAAPRLPGREPGAVGGPFGPGTPTS